MFFLGPKYSLITVLNENKVEGHKQWNIA